MSDAPVLHLGNAESHHMVRKVPLPLPPRRHRRSPILMGLHNARLGHSKQDALDTFAPPGLHSKLLPSHLRFRRVSAWAGSLRQTGEGHRRTLQVDVSRSGLATRSRAGSRAARTLGVAAGHARLSHSLHNMAVAEFEHPRPAPIARPRRTFLRRPPRTGSRVV